MFFLILDFFLSSFFKFNSLRKDCFEFFEIKTKDKKHYSYKLKKNCSAIESKTGANVTYKVKTDKYGHRKKNPEKKYDIGSEKNIFLGDSFAYGFGLDYSYSIPEIIEEHTSIESINLSVPGYSPSILQYNLMNFISQNKDLLIKNIFYLMDITDLHDESNRWKIIDQVSMPVIINKQIQSELENEIKSIENLYFTKNLITFARYYSRKIKYKFSEIIDNFLSKKKEIGSTQYGNFIYLPNNYLDRNFWINNLDVGKNNLMENVKKISQLSESIEANFYIVIYPWPDTLYFGEKTFSWQNFAKETCDYSRCKKIISLFKEFNEIKYKDSKWQEHLYLKNDVHFSKEGAAIVAKKIISEVF